VTVQHTEVNGVSLEWDTTGHGPPLVYLHGLSGNLEVDRRLCQRLGDHFTVMWYSSRGHGRSSAPATRAGWGYGHFAADLDAMIDVVGFERPFLVGGSHGANTILRHAVEHPDRAVSGAAVIAPGGNALRRPPRLTYAALRTVQWWAQRQGEDGLVKLITGMEPGSGTADEITIAAARTHDFAQLRAALRHVPDQQAVVPQLLASSQLACVVSAWRDDPIIHPYEVGTSVAGLLPRARFEEIEPMADRPADDVAETAAVNVWRWYQELND